MGGQRGVGGRERERVDWPLSLYWLNFAAGQDRILCHWTGQEGLCHNGFWAGMMEFVDNAVHLLTPSIKIYSR